MNLFEGKGTANHEDDIFPAIDEMRIPIEYLANLLSAGDKKVIRTILKKMATMRTYMRSKNANREPKRDNFEELNLNDEVLEDMYRLLAIAKYDERFVIPEAHKEHASELLKDQGSCGLDFDGGPGSCGVF
jgi:nitrate reductase beta subunit